MLSEQPQLATAGAASIATPPQPTEAAKKCSRCGERKPLTDFHRNRVRYDGRSVYCAPCTRLYNRMYYGEMAHDCIVAKAYSLKRGQYARMLNEQNGVCASCGEPETAQFGGKIKRLSVDHDHRTGQARALLCNRCNNIIGRADDDPKILMATINYLHRHGK